MVLLIVDKQDCVVYIGNSFSVEWYYEPDGYSQAYDYYVSTSQAQKRKFFVLVKRMAEFGKISDITKFRNEGDEVYAFKPQPDRYLCFFIKGKRIIITNAFCKKSQKIPKNEIERSLKNKKRFFEREMEGKTDGNNL
jgi:phage-related protein